MIRILFLTRRFEYGGAERQLIALAKGLDKARFAVTIVPFYQGGELFEEAERIPNAQVIPLRKKGRWDLFSFLWSLWQVVVRSNPHIIYGYMGVANLVSLLMGKLSGSKVVWSVRASNMDLDRYDWLTGLAFRLERPLSRFAHLIIVNSVEGKRYHVTHGFPDEKMVVIPNGIDTWQFRPDPMLREKVRAEWSVSEKETLIGLPARLDPMKDHPTFLQAAALLSRERPDVRFVCVGEGNASYRLKLQALSKELRLTDRLIWTGFRADMHAVYNALDVACSSSSYGEGFSNVIGEAMACGVPCVVTDVGDSRWIVGETGLVVPPLDLIALCSAWRKMLGAGVVTRTEWGYKARERVIHHFSLERLIAETHKVLTSIE